MCQSLTIGRASKVPRDKDDVRRRLRTAALAAALQRRGVEANLATLAAMTGMAVFGHAARSWYEDPSVSLGTYLERAFQALRGLSASGAPAPR